MGIFRYCTKKVIRTQAGQSMVEYILLLGVIGVLFNTVLSSSMFKDLMKGDKGFFYSMRIYLESSYRYPYFSKTKRSSYSDSAHDSYSTPSSETRFWGPLTPR